MPDDLYVFCDELIHALALLLIRFIAHLVKILAE